MKKSFKTFSKFTSILICLFVLTKCQTEEITIDNHKHSSEFKKETGSFAKFNLREYTTNLKIFNKTKKTGERLNRATEQDGFYFTIDTTSILKMSNGVTESYTIKVHNNQTPENSFQNLIIAKYKNNAPKAYLYTYFPDQEYKNRILNDFDTDFTGTATFEQLDITKINYQARCENMTVRLCSYKYVHIAGSGCANTYIGTIRVCNLDPLYSGSGTANPNPNSPNGSDNPPADGPTTSGGGIVTSNPQAYLGVPTDILPNITDLVGASVSAKFIFLMQALELNLIQSTWVGTNDDRINTVFNYLENNNNSQGRTFLKELIDLAIINPLSINDYVVASPNFKMKKIDQLRYPKFTQMVKNLKANVQNNPNVLAALIMHSGLTEAQVLNKLTFGQGPLIDLVPNLVGPSGPNYGNFNHNTPNIININENFALGLQNAQLNSTIQATSFLMAITLLHEFVHYGNLLTGYDTNGNETGNLFEEGIFGVLITKNNAGQYFTQFK